MNKKFSVKTIVILAGSYIATIIGSGFATGQEILQFFSYYGIIGIIGIIIAMVLFSFIGAEFLNRGRLVKPKDTMKMFTFYFGKTLGTVLEYFVPLFFFAVFVVMISGSGATMSEYYGFDPYVGRVVMAVLAYVTVSLGLKKLSNVIGNIGPVIIVFTISVGLISLISNLHNLPASLEYLKTAGAAFKKPAPNAVLAGFLYTAYNVSVLAGFLGGLGATAENEKDTFWGGVLGGIFLMLSAGVMYFAMLAQAEAAFSKNIPTLYLADQIHPMIGKLFSVVLLLGIFSTATPLLWMCSNRIAQDSDPKFKWVALVITILGLIGGQFDFGTLVGTIYPYTGYIGIAMMVFIVVKIFKLKAEGKTGFEEMQEIEKRKA